MKKTLKMSINDLKQSKKSLVAIFLVIMITMFFTIITRNNESANLLILAVADLLEKLIIPFFVYFGAKNYKTTLKNTLQIGETRFQYFMYKVLSIMMMSVLLSLITTPISYYLSSMGAIDAEGFAMPIFLGVFNPIIFTIYSYAGIAEVTIISSLIYSFTASLSFLTVALFNKIGGIRLFTIYCIIIFILTSSNNLLISKVGRPDLIDIVLGFSGTSVSLITPMISLILFLVITLYWTQFTIIRTEV